MCPYNVITISKKNNLEKVDHRWVKMRMGVDCISGPEGCGTGGRVGRSMAAKRLFLGYHSYSTVHSRYLQGTSILHLRQQ